MTTHRPADGPLRKDTAMYRYFISFVYLVNGRNTFANLTTELEYPIETSEDIQSLTVGVSNLGHPNATILGVSLLAHTPQGQR